MKRSTLFLFALLAIAFTSYSQPWQPLGPKEDSPCPFRGDYPKIVTRNGEQYIAFQDGRYNGKATVRKFSGGSWNYVGTPGFSAGQVTEVDLGIANDGTIYVAYLDAGYVSVKKFDGTSWTNAGPARISGANPGLFNFALSGNTPYICYYDQGATYVNIKKYDGTNWVDVGSSNLALYPISIDLAADDNGTPYIAFVDWGSTHELSVKKYDGTNWVQAGNSNFTGDVDFYNILTDHNNIPYVVYQDKRAGNYLTVQKLDGTNIWSFVGTQGFSQAGATAFAMAVGTDNTLYTTYRNPNHYLGMIVRKFDGTTWQEMPGRAFEMAQPAYVSIAAGGNDQVYITCKVTDPTAPPPVDNFENGKWLPLSKGITECNGCGVFSLMQTKDGTPYVLSHTTDNRAELKKFDGGKWTVLPGSTLGDTSLTYLLTAMAPDDTIYAVYVDYLSRDSIKFKKYDGNGWISLGSQHYATFGAPSSLAISKSGIAYLTCIDGQYLEKLTLARFNGSNWVHAVPQEVTMDRITGTTLALDQNEVPYVAYSLYPTNDVKVMRHDGSNWNTAGGRALFTGIRQPSLLVSDSNEVLFYYTDQFDVVTINKLKPGSTKWEILDYLRVAKQPSVALDKYNRPFVSFSDPTSGTIKVKKYIDAKWVDEATISSGLSSGSILSIRNENAVVVYGYWETFAKGGVLLPSGIEETSATNLTASIYPNPANNILKVSMDEESCRGALVLISDMLGRQVYNNVLDELGQMSVNTSNIPAGLYILNISHEGRKVSKKISIVH